MDLMSMWKKYKKMIILAGFAIGFLYVMGFIPETIDFFGENTILVYAGVIAFAGFTFYKFYWDLRSGVNNVRRPMPNYKRTVSKRDLRNPRFTDDVLRGRGVNPESVAQEDFKRSDASFEEDRVKNIKSEDSEDVFARFKKDY